MALVGLFRLGMFCDPVMLQPSPRSTPARQEGGPPRPTQSPPHTRRPPPPSSPTPGGQFGPAVPVPRTYPGAGPGRRRRCRRGPPAGRWTRARCPAGKTQRGLSHGTAPGGAGTGTHTHPGVAHGHGQAGQGGRGAHPEEERVLQPHGVEVHPLLSQLPAEIVQTDTVRRCTAACRLHLPGQAAARPGAAPRGAPPRQRRERAGRGQPSKWRLQNGGWRGVGLAFPFLKRPPARFGGSASSDNEAGEWQSCAGRG